MNEERMRILRMIQEGTLSAEEGARLLEALGDENASRPGERVEPRGEGRNIKIRAYDRVTGREKINLNIPIGFAKLLGNLVPESQRRELESHGIHFDDLLRAVDEGRVGKIVDIDDHDREEKVEISIE